MEFDCGITKENKWFRYRAAAIIIEDGCMLFIGNENENYYYSVGGGVHIGEKAEDACLREVFEETGVRYEIDRLCVIHENFFTDSKISWTLSYSVHIPHSLFPYEKSCFHHIYSAKTAMIFEILFLS